MPKLTSSTNPHRIQSLESLGKIRKKKNGSTPLAKELPRQPAALDVLSFLSLHFKKNPGQAGDSGFASLETQEQQTRHQHCLSQCDGSQSAQECVKSLCLWSRQFYQVILPVHISEGRSTNGSLIFF